MQDQLTIMSGKGRFDAGDLVAFARAALEGIGLSSRLSPAVAEILVEGDLLGHDTHGLALLPAYLASGKAGNMALEGEPRVLNERPVTALWDGRKLPGPWLVSQGLELAMDKAEEFGSYTLSIRDSHHTAGLVSYLKPAVDRGLVALLMVSDPTERCVAPFGGRQPVLSTNPFAIGYPTPDGAVLLDMSTSVTTNGMVNRLYKQKQPFVHDWLIDAEGRPSRDPAVRFAEPPGAIMPLGGLSSGHKGTGLGMTVEALTHGLSGNGRHVVKPQGWVNNVFLQVLDPSGFGGLESFVAETGYLGDAIRSCLPIEETGPAPRVPGARALRLRAERLAQGVPLSDGVLGGLCEWAGTLGLAMPVAR